MNRRPEIGFKSYDRLFPSQDSMPSGGFGNLIALTLQRSAREDGNGVVRLPADDENADEPWKMSPSRRRQGPVVMERSPERINVVLADQVYVDRTDLPPLLVAQLVRIAAF